MLQADDGGWPMVQGDSWAGEKFALAEVVGKGRRYLNSNWLMSTWVYLDDFNTDHNVIYVGHLSPVQYQPIVLSSWTSRTSAFPSRCILTRRATLTTLPLTKPSCSEQPRFLYL